MVQRKASDQPKSPAEQKQSHGPDLLKKMRRTNFVKAFDLYSFGKASEDIQFKKATSTPIRNYMKPTSSSDARKMNKVQVTPTSPAGSTHIRALKVHGGEPRLKPVSSSKKRSSLNVDRATCSSTLKDFRFPDSLELIPGANEVEGNSRMRVCPYTYCSLNGHSFQPLPPLKCFISARRKLLRNQNSMKLKVLPLSKASEMEKKRKQIENDLGEDIISIAPNFSLDVYSTLQEDCLGKNMCDELSFQLVDEASDRDQEYEMGPFTDSTEEEDTETETEEEDAHGFANEESLQISDDENPDLPSQFTTDNKKELPGSSDTTEESTRGASNPSTKRDFTRKTPAEETHQVKEFNPRPPNFLPFEAGPEAEKVDLRHQAADERKGAEEWMIDYALQRAVAKLSSARKRRVALLVQAFENVVPLTLCEEPIGHGAPAFTRPRSIQACS